MRRKLFFLIVFILFFLLASGISAQGVTESGDQSSFLDVILNFVILLIICSCLFYTKKIESFLKGGELFLGWFLIFISFLVLVCMQFLKLGNSMNVVRLSSNFYFILKLIWVILLVWGIYRLKKVLT
jgi:hypothetical protein